MHDNWYHHWVVRASLDDQLWHQALVMNHILESLCGSEQGVTFGFRRNLDVAGNGGLEGRKCVRPIAIDYRTVAGTAGAECKGDRRSKGPDGWSLEQTPTALQRHKGEET